MRNIDQKYDELINRIKAVTPEPNDPREMTDNILSAIKELPVKPRVSRILYISAWASSIAAISLIVLFLSVYKTPLPRSETRTCAISHTTYPQQIVCVTNTNKKDIIYKTIVQKMNQRKKQYYLQTYVLMNLLNN